MFDKDPVHVPLRTARCLITICVLALLCQCTAAGHHNHLNLDEHHFHSRGHHPRLHRSHVHHRRYHHPHQHVHKDFLSDQPEEHRLFPLEAQLWLSNEVPQPLSDGQHPEIIEGETDVPNPEAPNGNGRAGGGPASDIHWPVKREAVVEGDLVLGGLMMVHEREDNITCGPVMPQGGIQALEAMLFTLDVINADRDMLPGITLGAHILDDCDKDTYGLEMAVDFIKGNKFIHYA